MVGRDVRRSVALPRRAIRGIRRPLVPALGVTACTVLFWAVAAAYADGGLPPRPYNYLHPPPSARALSHTPQSGSKTYSAETVRSGSWFVFTGDTQAGLSATAGQFRLPTGARALHISIRPVETPPGLPTRFAPDGNAYRMVATAQPQGVPVNPIKPVQITLRWPHLPFALEVYDAGRWRQVCNQIQAVYTTSVIICPSTVLGTFLAVIVPSKATTAPVATTTSTPISRWYPLIIGVGIAIIAGVIAYFVSRPRPRPAPRKSGRRKP